MSRASVAERGIGAACRRAEGLFTNRSAHLGRRKSVRRKPMSKKSAEHHRKASEHATHVARHHEERPSITWPAITRRRPIMLTQRCDMRSTREGMQRKPRRHLAELGKK
jgi:hypothetical protein